MSDLPFDFDSTRTEFSDAAYAAIGRALVFATRRSKLPRTSRSHWPARSDETRGASDGESIDDIFERLTQEYWQRRRLRHHETAVALYEKLPKDIHGILRTGRLARNEIAHELTLGVTPEIETEDGRSGLLRSLRVAVGKIADAERIVCVLAHLETREPLPTVAAFEEFPEKVVRWVSDIEE